MLPEDLDAIVQYPLEGYMLDLLNRCLTTQTTKLAHRGSMLAVLGARKTLLPRTMSMT
jgi:hypothetical protein